LAKISEGKLHAQEGILIKYSKEGEFYLRERKKGKRRIHGKRLLFQKSGNGEKGPERERL